MQVNSFSPWRVHGVILAALLVASACVDGSPKPVNPGPKNLDTADLDTIGETDDILDTDPTDTDEPVERPVTPEDFSHVGLAALEALAAYPGSQYVTWNFSADFTPPSSWVVQTPRDHWGVAVSAFDVSLRCDGDACDPDFHRPLCSTTDDCPDGSTCQELQATVTVPGQQPYAMCLGHSDRFLDEIYDTIIQGETFVDIASLTQPDGLFLAAMRNALTYLDNSPAAPIVRVNVASMPAVPIDTEDIVEDLTRDMDPNSSMEVYVGAWRKSIDSWNHSKIIAVDEQILLQGGHNLWSNHYLENAPVHDLSMFGAGTVVGDAHRFLDRIWEYTCDDVTITGWTERDSFPLGIGDCPPAYGSLPDPPMQTGGRVISTGRLGGVGEDPSDEALLAMMRAANETIHMSLQDIGPVRLTDFLNLSDWPDEVMREMSYALARGVDIYLVLSAPNSVPADENPTFNNYGNGWTSAELVSAFDDWLVDNPDVLPMGVGVRDLLCEKFHVTELHFSSDEHWVNGHNIGNHSKYFMVDDVAFYLGSQNLYPADLAEYGLIVDDEPLSAAIRREYWDPMWRESVPFAVSGASAPGCTYDQ